MQEYRCGIGSAGGEIEVLSTALLEGAAFQPRTYFLSALPIVWCHRKLPTCAFSIVESSETREDRIVSTTISATSKQIGGKPPIMGSANLWIIAMFFRTSPGRSRSSTATLRRMGDVLGLFDSGGSYSRLLIGHLKSPDFAKV